jgi:hypothetical protein
MMSDPGIETLKTLFDGILGASLGALVAMLVLKRTLRDQRRGLSAQLEKQEEHLSRQLNMQENSLGEQLFAQQLENVRQRERDVASKIIGLLVELHPASKVRSNDDKIAELGNQLLVNVTRLRLDCGVSEEPFCDVLEEWARHLTHCALRISTEPEPWPEEAEFTEVTQIQRSHVIRHLTDWCRGEHRSRLAITSLLELSLEVERRDGGRVWRLQIAPDTLSGDPTNGTRV